MQCYSSFLEREINTDSLSSHHKSIHESFTLCDSPKTRVEGVSWSKGVLPKFPLIVFLSILCLLVDLHLSSLRQLVGTSSIRGMNHLVPMSSVGQQEFCSKSAQKGKRSSN